MSPKKRISQLLKAYEVADKDYDYEGGEQDYGYENSDHESEQHAEDCDWIYDNCTCGQNEKFELNYDWEDNGEY